MIKKVAILGGTFDPIHHGHLALAKHVLKTLAMDEIWFMPALVTPLKNRSLSAFSLRCAMIAKAIGPYRKMRLCTLEEELPSPSYTIETVKELQKRYPHIAFSWIIGDDQYIQLNQWKSHEELKKRIQFICVHRAQNNLEKEAGICFIEDFHNPISSTAVRLGNFHDVPHSVRNIIFQEGLYIDELIRHRLSEHRYQHSISMTKVALQLAKAHHVKLSSAYLAGMLHDVCKEMNKEEAQRIISIIQPDAIAISDKIWHQWLGADYVKTHLGLMEKATLSAIEHHVKGDGKSKLAKIIYIADKIDPMRGYDVSNQLAMSMKDLDQGIAMIKKQQKHYIKAQEEINV